jgi:hypothetical protein
MRLARGVLRWREVSQVHFFSQRGVASSRTVEQVCEIPGWFIGIRHHCAPRHKRFPFVVRVWFVSDDAIGQFSRLNRWKLDQCRYCLFTPMIVAAGQARLDVENVSRVVRLLDSEHFANSIYGYHTSMKPKRRGLARRQT